MGSIRGGQRFSFSFFFFHRVHTGSAPPPPKPHTQLVPGTVPTGLKRAGREADHSFPSNSEVKNAYSRTSSLNEVIPS